MEMHGAKTPPAEEEATVKANYRWVQESKLIAYQSDDGYHGPVYCLRCRLRLRLHLQLYERFKPYSLQSSKIDNISQFPVIHAAVHP